MRIEWPATRIAAALAFCAFVLFTAQPVGAVPPAVLELTEGEFLFVGQPGSDSTVPPADGELWVPVSLPHFWPLERPGELAIGWYRLAFERPENGVSELAVYLPRFESNVRVFINGNWIGESGPLGSLNWNQPHYFPFSSGVLTDGTNTVDIRLEAYGTPGAGLRPIEMGSHEVLEPRWRSQWWFRVGATEIGTVLAVFAALLFGSIWLGKSRDSVYGWCSLSAVSWGVNSLNYHVQETPLSYWAWKWLVHAGLDLFATCIAFLVLRLVGVRLPRTERAILVFAGLAITIPILAPRAYFFALANFFHAGSLLIGILSAFWLIYSRRRIQRYEFGTFLVLAVVFIGFLIRDYAIQVAWISPDSPRLFHLTAPVLFSVFAITLLLRFITTYRDAEEANLILEERIEEKQAELEQHYSRVSELEQLQAVSDERERIMREMHDGMGGHLVSALSMVEEREDDSPEVANALRSSLDEMRLMVYSLDSSARDIAALFATLRERTEPRLKRAGIRFRWQVTDLPTVDRFGPEHYLHLLRIFQEAITNVLKHANAKIITVKTGVDRDSEGRELIFLRIEDDGLGISESADSGYGTQNMTFRANAIDGELNVSQLERGTVVDLRFPVSPCQ
jgi:signal transduction histidine kinase